MEYDLTGMDTPETERWIADIGLEPYRARQIRRWLFKRQIGTFEEMTDLPKQIRSLLKQKANIYRPKIRETWVSADKTKKFLFELWDGSLIESVLIPERDHWTLCISSQSGCAMNCHFCLTGKQGLKRNLTAAEIVGQVLRIKKVMEKPDYLSNIVFMGMGEPLANYEAVTKAIGNLIDPDAMAFSKRKVTVSTCGLVPGIDSLGRDTSVNLAVSLNAADDSTRSRLMPINMKYPIAELISACRRFPLPNRRMITFEYILIDGINDREQDALRLCGLLAGIRAKINLIALNPHAGADLRPPSRNRILKFQEILIKNHFTAIMRKSKGRDIMAACGQLGRPTPQSRRDSADS